jgi:GNAT superfamily N-acetyltransferase
VLCFVLEGQDQEIAGGIVAQIHWDWLFIDLMWMKVELRGHGYGSRLLMRVEDDARKRGARHAHLDTFSFQAPGFYQKHGYQVFGELHDFPQGCQRYFLTKRL